MSNVERFQVRRRGNDHVLDAMSKRAAKIDAMCNYKPSINNFWFFQVTTTEDIPQLPEPEGTLLRQSILELVHPNLADMDRARTGGTVDGIKTKRLKGRAWSRDHDRQFRSVGGCYSASRCRTCTYMFTLIFGALVFHLYCQLAFSLPSAVVGFTYTRS
jgi:hypothetical protein